MVVLMDFELHVTDFRMKFRRDSKKITKFAHL